MLEYQDVCLELKQFKINHVSFSLEEGYIMALAGKNGSGKTMLMNMIPGIINNYTGKILIDNTDCKKDPNHIKNVCAIISESANFFFNTNALHNAALLSQYYDNWNQDTFEKYLKAFEVSSYTKLCDLSKGTFIKFQLAFAAAHEPKLYIMDEPSAGLDPVFRKDFLSQLRELTNQNTSILISSHNLKELDLIADYVTLIDNGELIHSKEHITNMKGDYNDFKTPD